MSMRETSKEVKKRTVAACARLFLENGFTETTMKQICTAADITVSTFQNLFENRNGVLMDLTVAMFGNQFDMARHFTADKLPLVYEYAVETSIQLTLTELNENLRELYTAAYSLPETSEYIYDHMTEKLERIFSGYLPNLEMHDFYEMEIGSAGLMRSYMARKCDIHFPLNRKLQRFLETSLRIYRVPEEEIQQIVKYIADIDIKHIANEAMQKLFANLEMKLDFKLSRDGE